MAARKSEPSQLERDAAEFGIGVRCGGWRLGLLVARNVEPGTAGRPTEESRTSAQLSQPLKTDYGPLMKHVVLQRISKLKSVAAHHDSSRFS